MKQVLVEISPLEMKRAVTTARVKVTDTMKGGAFLITVLDGKYKDAENVLTPEIYGSKNPQVGQELSVILDRNAEDILVISKTFKSQPGPFVCK